MRVAAKVSNRSSHRLAGVELLGSAKPANARPVLPIYFDDFASGSLHDFKSPSVLFGDQQDYREPAPLGLQWVDIGDSAYPPK
jgi:hypothetical protein